MAELERVSTTQRALLEEVRAAGEERQRAILEGAIGREARAALRTRARTATAATAAHPAGGSSSAAIAQRSARMGRLLQDQEQGRSPSAHGGGSAGSDVISIPAAALREISDPATGTNTTRGQSAHVIAVSAIVQSRTLQSCVLVFVRVRQSYWEPFSRFCAWRNCRQSLLESETTKYAGECLVRPITIDILLCRLFLMNLICCALI